MTSLLSWLPELWRANWTLGNQLHRLLIKLFGSYILAVIVCVFLSAFGLPAVIGLIGALYVFVVIVIPLNPLVWEALAVGGYVRGQVGGEEGFSIKDGIDRVWEWTKVLTGKWGKFLLFYGTVPFVWTAINDTEGAVLVHLVLLPLIPPAIYYSVERWPNSQRIFNWIGLVYLALVFLAVGVGIYTSIQHRLADPSTKVIQGYERDVQEQLLADEKQAAKEIIAKLKQGQPLTKKEKEVWEYLRTKAEHQRVKTVVKTEAGSLLDRARDTIQDAPGTIYKWWYRGNPPAPKQEEPAKSTAAGAINSPAPATPQATPAPAPAAKPAPTIQVVWEGYYAPSVHRGPMSIGSHPAGQYRVEGEGLRQQVDPNNNGHYRSHDWRGEVVSEGGRCIVIVPNPGQMSIPFTGPGQCYGAVIVTGENSTHHWVADRKCFDHRGGELFINVNNGAHPDRYASQGGHKLRLIQC